MKKCYNHTFFFIVISFLSTQIACSDKDYFESNDECESTDSQLSNEYIFPILDSNFGITTQELLGPINEFDQQTILLDLLKQKTSAHLASLGLIQQFLYYDKINTTNKQIDHLSSIIADRHEYRALILQNKEQSYQAFLLTLHLVELTRQINSFKTGLTITLENQDEMLGSFNAE